MPKKEISRPRRQRSPEKLQIAIDRWIKSKASGNDVDRIIDLGIALEALYVTRKDKIERQLCHRASLYLAEDVASPEKFNIDYRCVVHSAAWSLYQRMKNIGRKLLTRFVSKHHIADDSHAVHNGQLGETAKFPDWSGFLYQCLS